MTGACVVYYRSKSGDTIDRIVWQYYGRQDTGLVEYVLAENPGIADQGAELPDGLRIALPDAPARQDEGAVRLWT